MIASDAIIFLVFDLWSSLAVFKLVFKLLRNVENRIFYAFSYSTYHGEKLIYSYNQNADFYVG